MPAFFICPDCLTVEEVTRGDFWPRLADDRDPRCAACASGRWHGAFRRRKATVGMLLLFGRNTFSEVPGGMDSLPLWRRSRGKPRPARRRTPQRRRHPSPSEMRIAEESILLARVYREHAIRGTALVGDAASARRLVDRGLAVQVEDLGKKGTVLRLTRKGRTRGSEAALVHSPASP